MFLFIYLDCYVFSPFNISIVYTGYTSKVPVLQFSKRTHIGCFAGTGIRTVRIQYAPMTHQVLFLFFLRLVLLGYGGGTLRVHMPGTVD